MYTLYTLGMHLVVHYHELDGIRYIRLVSLKSTDAYISELKRVYPKIDVTDDEDENMQVFFNVSDMLDRLVADIGFKTFKGCGKLESKLKGLYKVPDKASADFFTTVFLPWVKGKIASYVDDLEEEDAFDVSLICNTQPSGLVDVRPENDNIIFDLVDYEIQEGTMFVINEDHIRSLIVEYVKNRKFTKVSGPRYINIDKIKHIKSFHNRVFIDVSTILDNIGKDIACKNFEKVGKLGACTNVRRWKIPDEAPENFYSSIFLPWAKEQISSYLPPVLEKQQSLLYDWAVGDNETEFLLESILKCINESVEPIGLESVEVVNEMIVSEQDDTNLIRILPVKYGRGYAVSKKTLNIGDVCEVIKHVGVSVEDLDIIEDEIINGNHNIMGCEEQHHYSLLDDVDLVCPNSIDYVFDTPYFRQDSKDGREPVTKPSRFLYLNTLKNTLHCLDVDALNLSEFEKLQEVTFKNESTNIVLFAIMQAGSIGREFAVELRELVSLLCKFLNVDDQVGKIVENPRNPQYEATKEYVKRNMSRIHVTPATIAINNVFQYLHHVKGMPESEINKNQIGSDLVDLGVKKTRKGKGNYYGLSCENWGMMTRVKKISWEDLRGSVPLVSPWNVSSYKEPNMTGLTME